MKIWIYVDGRQEGPYELEQLLDKPVTPDTKVWYEGLPKWYPAGYLDELRPLFDGSLAEKMRGVQEQPAESHEAGNESEAVSETIEETTISQVSEPMQSFGPSRFTQDSPASAAHTSAEVPECPPTYIGWAIFLTICCCSPLSVGALVASICVSTFYNSGKYDKARKASDWAVWLIMISFALGFLPGMVWQAFFM